MKLLFVCTGNTCRSPMAEGIFNSLDSGAESRGLMAEYGQSASENAVKAMDEMGIDISNHVSKPLLKEDVLNAEIILTMTKRHKAAICSAMPEACDKVFTLGEYAGGGDVPDPYGGDIDTYRDCADELYKNIERVIEKLQ